MRLEPSKINVAVILEVTVYYSLGVYLKQSLLTVVDPQGKDITILIGVIYEVIM